MLQVVKLKWNHSQAWTNIPLYSYAMYVLSCLENAHELLAVDQCSEIWDCQWAKWNQERAPFKTIAHCTHNKMSYIWGSCEDPSHGIDGGSWRETEWKTMQHLHATTLNPETLLPVLASSFHWFIPRSSWLSWPITHQHANSPSTILSFDYGMSVFMTKPFSGD